MYVHPWWGVLLLVLGASSHETGQGRRGIERDVQLCRDDGQCYSTLMQLSARPLVKPVANVTALPHVGLAENVASEPRALQPARGWPPALLERLAVRLAPVVPLQSAIEACRNPEVWGTPLPEACDKDALRRRIQTGGLVGSAVIVLFCWFIGSREQAVPTGGDQEEEINLKEEIAGFTKDLRKIAPEELGVHTHRGDLWLAVDGVVCDLTDFATVHPGGVDILLQHAGTEAGEAFREVGHSNFAASQLRSRAVGMLVAGAHGSEEAAAGGTSAAAGAGLLSRLFTKEDFGGYNIHKLLGITVLVQYFLRMAFLLSGARIPGHDQAGFGSDYFSLACAWLCAVLQFSSFRFHVPRNRILGSPMIWQEWRTHNLIFVMRHVLVFTIKWYCWHVGGVGPRGSAVALLLAWSVLFAQLWTVDVATAYLREDRHESLTATWPFWKGCPKWTESFLKFYYTLAQIQATTLSLDTRGHSLYMVFLVIFPFQWASLLMTLVRKGVITTTGYHVGYLWSLMQVVYCGMVAQEDPHLQAWVMWTIVYLVRARGLNKYGLWIGVMAPHAVNAVFPDWADPSAPPLMLATPGVWVIWALLQWLLRGQALEKRTRRYLESRPKTLELIHRERVSESLVWLRFQLPAGFTTGLTPGQHVRIHCPNPSRGLASWNGRTNLEENPKTLSRSYTPVSAPDAPTLDLIIRDYPPSCEQGFPEGGRASAFLAETLRVGEQVPVSGPHGHKVYHGDGLFLVGRELRRASRCAALVGGSGVTPALAVLRELRAEAREAVGQPLAVADVSVLHVTRTAKDALADSWYEPDYEAESKIRSTVRNFVTSEVGAGEKASQSRHDKLTALVQETFPEPADGVVVIVCGPQQFVSDFCLPLLRKIGYRHVIVMW